LVLLELLVPKVNEEIKVSRDHEEKLESTDL
jgi:hypothetical protein